MGTAALISWLITATGGFYLFVIWIRKGGLRQKTPRPSRFRPGVVFSHFLLADIGLIILISYLITDKRSLAWLTFGLTALVALLGYVLLFRWLPTYRTKSGQTIARGPGHSTQSPQASTDAHEPAERHFPTAMVIGHGAFALVTAVLVLLTALGA